MKPYRVNRDREPVLSDLDTIQIDDVSSVPAPFIDTYTYWLTACGGKWAPTWRRFDLGEIDVAVLPWSIVVDVEQDPADLFYRFWGTERTHLIGVEMTNKKASEIPNAHMRDANFKEYRDVIARKSPLLCATPVVTSSGLRAVFQSIRLPISDDEKTVTKNFLCHRFCTDIRCPL